MRLLSVDPKRPSAAQARDMLAAVALGQLDADADPIARLLTEDAPAEAEAPDGARVDGPVRRRRATALLGLLLGLLVLVGGATIATLATGSGVAAAPRATPSTTAASAPAASAPAASTPVAASPAATSPQPSRAPVGTGGATGFTSFYARMQLVTVDNPRLVGENTVTATVRFVQKDGTTSNEPYQFVMATDGPGKIIMESFARVNIHP